jgi:2-oxoglutarate dehydrogenase E2 component (dihydrolipoamide succinyltransferase)
MAKRLYSPFVNVPPQCTLVRWYRDDGEEIHRDEPMCEIESEKASVDVPAPGSGILRHLVKAGEEIRSNSEVARIDPG